MEDRTHILEQAAGVALPADYKKFLAKYAGGAKLADEKLRYTLATADVLAAPFPFDQPRIDRPLFEAHFIYLGRLRDAGVLVFDGGNDPVAPDHFAKMITIGFGERPDAPEHGLPPTHVVVLDPADGSVRLVPIDPPAVVRRLADSFGKWHRKVKAKPKAKTAARGKKATTKAGAKSKAPKKVAAKKPPTKAAVLAALAKQQKLKLPAPYERFLKSKTAKLEVVTADGRLWRLATPDELAETSYSFTETAAAKPVPFVRCTRAFADLLKAGQNLKGVPIVGEKKKKFTLARLRKGICVGASDGDPVFLDPSDEHSVWTYSQDQMTVARVAPSFAKFIKPKPARKPAKKAQEMKAAA
jgi:hypothetical protein